MKTLATFSAAAAWLAASAIAETKIKFENLPPAVQKSVKDETRNATIVGIVKEKEKGKTVYEVETKVNGKTRDIMIDSTGKVYLVEEETPIESIPAPAREAILKKAGSGKVTLVETLTKGSEVSYEAAYVGKKGKKAEVGVNADGSPHK
jgi:uncharacterized membrane protein YkoI